MHKAIIAAGSRLSGAIDKAAGPQLEAASRGLGPVSPSESVVTPACSINAQFIVQTVCPGT